MTNRKMYIVVLGIVCVGLSWPFGAICFLGAASQNRKTSEDAGMNKQAVIPSASAQLNEVTAQLSRGDKGFFVPPLLFSFWVRGGDPGEGFTSDKLEVQCEKELCEANFVRTRFDEEYSPPYLAEQFTGHLSLQDVTDLLKLAVGSSLFRKEFPSEKKPPIADILKETWVLSKEGIQLQKTFFEPFPEDLVAIRKICNDLMAKIEDQ